MRRGGAGFRVSYIRARSGPDWRNTNADSVSVTGYSRTVSPRRRSGGGVRPDRNRRRAGQRHHLGRQSRRPHGPRFDAATGAERDGGDGPGSQPGDLAYAKGKIYVAEEFAARPAIAILDAETGAVISRIFTPAGSRPHHVHASVGGNLVAVGLFGTDRVAVIDTRDDTLLGPWDSNPLTTNGRVHAGVFAKDGHTLYLANEGANEVLAMDPRTGFVFWRMRVPGAHELAVTHDGKRAYVSRRTANKLAVIDLENQTFADF